jgi:hypothetical protein
MRRRRSPYSVAVFSFDTMANMTFPFRTHIKNCGLKNTEEHQRLMAGKSETK